MNFYADKEIFAMASEPLEGYSADDYRKLCNSTLNEAQLAVLYAGAHNKTGWLMHDLDDEEADINTECVYQEWSAIEEELRGRIIAILEQEDPDKNRSQLSSKQGYYYIVKPFMLRNGFVDANGWWIRNDDYDENDYPKHDTAK